MFTIISYLFTIIFFFSETYDYMLRNLCHLVYIDYGVYNLYVTCKTTCSIDN